MRVWLTLITVLALADPAGAAPSDEGTVTAKDGKGGFQVATKRNGTLDLQAGKRLLEDDPARRTGAYPHSYKELQVGDRIEVTWGATKIASGVRIIRRAVVPCPPPESDN